jgi:hypothetical protein
MPTIKIKNEKRAHKRFYFCLPVKYKLQNRNYFKDAIICKDISGQGLGILLHEALAAEETLTVALYPQDSPHPIDAVCRVAWCTKNRNGDFKSGLEFLKLKQGQRFVEFLSNSLTQTQVPCAERK